MIPSTRDFDFELDEALIAQEPARFRDRSRLMVLDRRDGCVSHRVFSELPDLLRGGDLLVLNDTRVIPAKFTCRRATGGKIEGLFCRETQSGQWLVMLKNAGRCKISETLDLVGSDGVRLILRESIGKGQWLLDVDPPGSAEQILRKAGATPLPPYIRRADLSQDHADRNRYQTVYAARAGAVAAPTAGLHFTDDIFRKLSERDIETVTVTLHVGMGTFKPVESDDLDGHEMHSEWYDLSPESAAKLNSARREGRRIVAVGTTSVRVIETLAGEGVKNSRPQDELFAPAAGWTDIFIYPPARFHAVDTLITNFHLPKSTLLMLTAAFCAPGSTDGIKVILNAYHQAVEQKYRFFSYGDAMLIE